MARVTSAQVQAVTGDTSADATLAITAASAYIDDTAVLGSSSLSEDMKTQIELYLAAHFLTITTHDGPLQENTLGEARERYHNVYGSGLKSTKFGQQAILLDVTGTLARLNAQAEKVAAKSARFTTIHPVDEINQIIDSMP